MGMQRERVVLKTDPPGIPPTLFGAQFDKYDPKLETRKSETPNKSVQNNKNEVIINNFSSKIMGSSNNINGIEMQKPSVYPNVIGNEYNINIDKSEMTIPESEDTCDESFITNSGTKLCPPHPVFPLENDKATKNESLLVPCTAVYASNYNFSVLAIALYIMQQDEKYRVSTGSSIGGGTLKMLAYAGAAVGQFVLGYLGDLIGRRKAMIFTLSLVFIGALGSAVMTWGNALTTLILMGFFRFILGVGSGGVYPLSAVSAAEGTASSKAEDRNPRVSWAYFFNVPGIISPYLLALIIWSITHNVDVNFRVLLGFGSLPVLLIVANSILLKDSDEFKKNKCQKLFKSLFNRNYWYHLIGTGVCWFLYDVAAYGILLAQPKITKLIWGPSLTVTDVIWQGIVLNSIGIPGCIFGILVVKQMGIKWLQFWGFIFLGLSAAVMAIVSAVTPIGFAQMFILAIINFFINWGPAVTTFIMPSTVFPPECRSTYNGISAAMGKIGAIVGIYSFEIILEDAGIAYMMLAAAVVSFLGAILTWYYVGQNPKTCSGAASQCFGSLLRVIPFYDPIKNH